MQVVYSNLAGTVRVVKSAGAKAAAYGWHHVQYLQTDGSWLKFFGSAQSTLEQACGMCDRIRN